MPTNELARGSTPMLRSAVRNSPFLSSVSPAGMTVLETAAYIAIFAMCVLFLYYGSSVLMPLALASLLSFVLTPAVRLLKKAGIPKVISVVIVVVVSISTIGGAGFVVGGQISDLLERIPSYEYNLLKKVSSLRSASVESGALERARSTLQDLQTELGRTNEKAANPPPQANSQNGPTDTKPIPVEIHQPPQPVLESTLALIRPLISPLATTGLIILFLFFILAQREDLRDRFLRLAGTGDLQRTTVALDDAGDRLSRYFIIQALAKLGVRRLHRCLPMGDGSSQPRSLGLPRRPDEVRSVHRIDYRGRISNHSRCSH